LLSKVNSFETASIRIHTYSKGSPHTIAMSIWRTIKTYHHQADSEEHYQCWKR